MFEFCVFDSLLDSLLKKAIFWSIIGFLLGGLLFGIWLWRPGNARRAVGVAILSTYVISLPTMLYVASIIMSPEMERYRGSSLDGLHEVANGIAVNVIVFLTGVVCLVWPGKQPPELPSAAAGGPSSAVSP